MLTIANKGSYVVKKCQNHVYVICECSLTCTIAPLKKNEKSLTGKEKRRINSDKNNFQDKFLLVQNTNLLRYRSTNLSKNARHSLHTQCSSSQAIYSSLLI